MRSKSYSGWLSVLALVVCLTGCAVQPLPPDSSLEELTPAEWKNEVSDSAQLNIEWSSFNDPELDALIQQALEHNLGVTAAVDSLRTSMLALDDANAAKSVVYSVDTAASSDKGRNFNRRENYSLSGRASYEIDIWGRRKNDVLAAELGIVDAELTLLATRISLAAEVADAYYTILVFDEQLRLRRKSLDYALRQQQQVQARHRAGIISGLELDNQEVEIQRLRSNIEDSIGQRSLQEDRLAVLTGQPPQAFALNAQSEPQLPTIRLAPGTPVDVLQERPDIRSAEIGLQLSEIRFDQARKSFWPTISLAGNSGLASDSLSDLVSNASWNWQIGMDFLTTLLDNGARARRVETARIAAAQAVTGYRRIILTALQEVESALNQQEVNLRQVEFQELQLAAQKRLAAETEARYKQGLTSGLELVRQQRALNSLQDQVLSTQLAGIRATISLFRAVGIAP